MVRDRFALLRGLPGAQVPKPKQPRAAYKGKTGDKEAIIQGLAEELAARLHLGIIRFPDGLLADIQRNGSPAAKAYVTQRLAGFPDLGLIRTTRESIDVLFLELKREGREREKHGGLDKTQIKWWESNGMVPLIAYGWADTEAKITAFWRGNLRNTAT